MSENRRIARAAAVVAAVTLASRISGLLRDVVTGYYFGAGSAADAFFVAFRLPNLLRRFVGEGAMSVAFIPVFSEYLGQRTPAQAERALRVLLTGFALIVAVLTLLGIALAPYWLALLAPGFAAQPEMGLTLELTRWLLPYLLLISLVALLGGYLNALRHFLAPALAPVLLNLAMIGCAVALVPLLSTPVFALVWGVLLGGVLRRSESPDPQRPTALFERGRLKINFDSHEAWLDGRPLELSLREFELLKFFVRNPNRVYDRLTILDLVWGNDTYVEPRTVDVHVRRLRLLVERDPARPELIHTVRGVGYKFNDHALDR